MSRIQGFGRVQIERPRHLRRSATPWWIFICYECQAVHGSPVVSYAYRSAALAADALVLLHIPAHVRQQASRRSDA